MFRLSFVFSVFLFLISTNPVFAESRMMRGEFLEQLFLKGQFSIHSTVPSPFTDRENTPYTSYIDAAYSYGVLEHSTRFFPDIPLTYEAMYTWSLGLYGIPVPRIILPEIVKYTEIQDIYKPVFSKVYELELVRPYSRTRFHNTRFVPKKEAEVFLQNLSLYFQGLRPITPHSQDLPGADAMQVIFNTLKSKYYKSETLPTDDMIYSALEGMVEGVGDPYTVYFPPEKLQQFSSVLDSTYEGIGAYIQEKEGVISIQGVIPHSPAHIAGVKAGDVIIKVGGVIVKGMSTEEVISLIKGPRKTTVVLSILRGNTLVEISVKREKIEIPNMSHSFDKGILLVRINSFSYKTDKEFEDVVRLYIDKGMKGIVVDLRQNPGGLLDMAESLLGFWIGVDEPVVQLKYRHYNHKKYVSKNQLLHSLPTVILVDSMSASASEILAGTLQEYGKAVIIGSQTYGKGSVQEVIQYPDGSALKITVAEWLTGKGSSIQGVGVRPSIEIVDDPTTEKDEVLERALEYLHNKTVSFRGFASYL